MEMFGAVLGLSIATPIVIAVLAGLLFPAFWLWMLVDSLVRPETEYPSKDISEKVLWAVLMVVLQPAAVLYFFIVWRPMRKVCCAQPPSVAAHA